MGKLARVFTRPTFVRIFEPSGLPELKNSGEFSLIATVREIRLSFPTVWRMIAALILAGVEPCAAGQIQVDTRPLDLGSSRLSLSSSGDLTLTPSGRGTYSFVFKSPSIVDGKLVIAIENPPEGYSQFRMELDLPFFAEQSLPFRIAAAMANDPLTDTGAANFIRSVGVGPGPGAIAENVLIHERARRYWAQRSKDLADRVRADANLDDVGIAYWLLYTTRNLILSNYLNPDEITTNAVGFFKTKLADPSEVNRLFIKNFVSQQVASSLVDSIEARDSFLYYAILLKIEGRLRIGDFAICEKARNLASQVIQLPAYQLSQFNGEFPSTVKAKADAIACMAHDLASLVGKSPTAPADKLQEVDDIVVAASDDLAEGAKALAIKSSRSGTPDDASVANFTVAVANLQQRISEFTTLRKQMEP